MDKLEQLKEKIEYIQDQTNYEIDLLLARKDKIETLVDYDGGFEIEFYLDGDIYSSTVSFLGSGYGGVNIEFSQGEGDDYGLVGRIQTMLKYLSSISIPIKSLLEYEELSIYSPKTFYEMIKKLNEIIDDELDRKIKNYLRD